MQILTEVVAGHPLSAATPLPFNVSCDVWVDGIRICGRSQDVNLALRHIDKRASHSCVTLKESGSVASTAYDFVGVSFDHVRKTVVAARKTVSKLDEASLSRMSSLEFLQLLGRLLFCAAANRTPLASFYWLLKIGRRIQNQFSRGFSDAIVLAPGSVAHLRRLRDAVKIRCVSQLLAAHKRGLCSPTPVTMATGLCL